MFSADNLVLSLLLSLLIMQPALAEVNSEAQKKFDAHLKIQPNRCAYYFKDDYCFAKLSIRWHTAQLDNFCVYEGEKKIYCWENRSRAKLRIQVQSKESQVFYLKHGDTIIDEKALTVVKITRRLKKRRRRPWHLF